jgi:hypothetical protein
MPYNFCVMQKHGYLLKHMDRDAFLRTVQRAERNPDEANESRQTLLRWAERLLPYLSRDRHMTVAEALDRYKADHGDDS